MGISQPKPLLFSPKEYALKPRSAAAAQLTDHWVPMALSSLEPAFGHFYFVNQLSPTWLLLRGNPAKGRRRISQSISIPNTIHLPQCGSAQSSVIQMQTNVIKEGHLALR